MGVYLMAKFKYIKKSGGSITLTLVPGEQADNSELQNAAIMSCHPIFLRPAVYRSGEITFSFKGEKCIALSRFLRNPVNKDQFYIIIAQLLEAYKIAAGMGLDPAKICLDPDFITICPNSGYLCLVYQPVFNLQSPNQGFMRCFGQICSMLKFSSPQDQASISGFIAFASRLPGFPVNDIENFIRSASPVTYNYIESNLSFNGGVPRQNLETPAETVPEEQKTIIRNTEPPVSTGINVKKVVVLVRRSSGEEIVIDKDVFVIGKERAKVDYCVAGNKTVSRVHATIFRREDGYYIRDNNSTNRTFINGTPIQPMTELKLNYGDAVRLSNEEFIFSEK